MKATIPPGFEMKLSDFWSIGASDKAPKDVYAGSGEGFVVPSKAPNKAGGKEFLRAMLSKAGAGEVRRADARPWPRPRGPATTCTTTALAIGQRADEERRPELVSVKLPDFYGDLDKESQNPSEELMAGRLTARAVRRQDAGGGGQGRQGQQHQEADPNADAALFT